MKRYASFVLRCWRLEDDQRRIEVEHVQTGARTRLRSMGAAVAWMDGCCGDLAGELGAATTHMTLPTEVGPRGEGGQE